MSFGLTYRAIAAMIEKTLLDTRVARDIVRKGLTGLLGSPASGTGHLTDLWGTYAQVDSLDEGGYEPSGSLVRYDPVDQPNAMPIRILEDRAEFLFPDGAQRPSFFADVRDIDELRMLVTVTSAGVAGSEMFLEMWTDLDKEVTHTFTPAIIPFVDSVGPRVPLDEVGLHVTDWHALDFGEDPFWTGGRLPAQLFWWVSTPALEDATVGIGLCQIHARAAAP